MMRARLLSVAALLVSFAILCLGHGLQSVLLPARGAMFESYPNLTTGAMMSAYYIGFILGTVTGPRLIARVGHIRVFAAGASGAAIIMLAFALMPHPVLWVLLRCVYGFCFVHLYTVMESWLNTVGEKQIRGKILSIYMIVNFLAMSAGQLLFFAYPPEGFELFSISAIMLSLAIVPLILSRSMQPSIAQAPEPFGLKQLFAVSPLGMAGALVAGLMGGAYWGLTAIFVMRLGYEQNAIAWFMSASLVGGLLSQWPLGYLSDRVNRRYVIILAAGIVCGSAVLLSLMPLWENPAQTFGAFGLVAIGALFGVGFHPLYSLCIAHANDFIGPENFVRASAGLQSVQSFGAILGPLLGGVCMYLGGYAMLFLYIAVLSGALILYTFSRLTANRPLRCHPPFRLLTRTGIFAVLMDPRSRQSPEQGK